MERRSADEIERRIRQWERARDRLGAEASSALVRFLNDEIDRLRHEKLLRTRPVTGGRRASDPRSPLPAP